MPKFPLSILSAAMLLSTVVPAMAGDYTVDPVKDASGKVSACQATNEKTNLSFLAAGDRVLLFAQSAKFPFTDTAVVKGSWAVDGGASAPFTSEGGGAHMVAFDVPNSAEAVASLTSGKRLDLVASNIKESFDLAGAGQAFNDLIQCITDASK